MRSAVVLRRGVALYPLHVESAVATRVYLSVEDAATDGAVDVAGGIAAYRAVVVRVVQVGEGLAHRTLRMVVLGGRHVNIC